MQITAQKLPLTTLFACTGDYQLSTDAASRLISRDIGASVALALHVPPAGMGGLLRFSYPDSRGSRELAEANPYLFADTVIAALLSDMERYGISKRDLRLHAVGGSSVAERGHPTASGKANELALKKILWREDLWLASEDLGGDFSHSIWLEPATGVSSSAPRYTALRRRFWNYVMPYSILLVEQSHLMREFLRRAISMPGLPEASCIESEDNRTAARLLEERPIDLIVMDTNTLAPGEENLLQRVRGNPKLQHIPCIVISSDTTAMRVQSMLDLGATAYLGKPLAPGPLRAEIARNLGASYARN